MLRDFAPKRTVFYTSGRASLETSFMFQLFARIYGTNNLPDSSNMCHESTSVALPETIGAPVSTVTLDDFEHTDCFFFFGHNTGTNAPRMLHPLQEARKRGARIVTFNPVKERGLVSFANPQSPVEMMSTKETAISTQYLQVKIGGDIAAVTGICKALIEADDRAQRDDVARVLDAAFIAEHTHGFESFAAAMRAADWRDIEVQSGLTRSALEAAATEYARAKAVMILFGMGITQHREGVLAVQMLTNLMLLGRISASRGRASVPFADIPTFKDSARWESRRSPRLCRWTSWPNSTHSSRRVKRACLPSMHVPRCATAASMRSSAWVGISRALRRTITCSNPRGKMFRSRCRSRRT